MQSLNPDANALHAAFCAATGRELRMNPTFERNWFDAYSYGITPDMVTLVMSARMKRQYANADQRFYCLSLKHLIGDSDRLAEFVDEAAALEANRRKRVFSPGKAAALEATGRPGEPEPARARQVSEIFDSMRKAT